ncbi:MAG: GtrA family protein [Pseudomonadota bacterium]
MMNLKIHNTYLRFLIAGGFNTLFGWLCYAAAILMGAQPWLALILATLTGVVFNFITLGGYAFRSLVMSRFPRFVLAYCVIYTTNLISLQALKPWVDNPIWAQLIITLPLALLSYVIMSKMVFNTEIAKDS